MPIYRQSYRSYDGTLRPRFRWWMMVMQEVRVLIASRFFLAILIVGLMHVILRMLQIIVFDVLSQNPNNQIFMALSQLEFLMIRPRLFFDFIRIQAPLVFIACMFAGSGSICNDFRNNLMEIYFSKPLSHWDYILGKTLTLVLIGLVLTGIPGVGLVVFHNMLLPKMETLRETWWLPFSVMGFSMIIVLSCSLGVLAFSAIFRSQRFAGIAVFMVLFGNLTLGSLLPQLLRSRNYLIVAYPMAMNRVGEFIFKARRPIFTSHWGWSMLFVCMVCAGSLWIIHLKIKSAEVAA